MLTHCLNHLHLLYHLFRRLKSSKGTHQSTANLYKGGQPVLFVWGVPTPKNAGHLPTSHINMIIFQPPETMTRRFSCSMAASADACSVSPIPLSCSSRASAGFQNMISISYLSWLYRALSPQFPTLQCTLRKTCRNSLQTLYACGCERKRTNPCTPTGTCKRLSEIARKDRSSSYANLQKSETLCLKLIEFVSAGNKDQTWHVTSDSFRASKRLSKVSMQVRNWTTWVSSSTPEPSWLRTSVSGKPGFQNRC